MRTTSPRRVALPAVAAVIVGLLAGCGGSGGSAPTSTSSSPEAAESPSDSPSEEAADDTETEAAPAAGADDCLLGSWVSDNETLAGQMEALMGTAVEGATVSTAGDIVMTFDGTTATAAYQGFTMEFTMTESGVDMVMDLGFDGTASSTYQASDGQLSIGSMDMSGVAITYTVKAGDQTMDMSDQLGDSMDGVGTSAGSTTSYTCDASTLTVAAESGEAELTQVYHRK